MSLDDPRIRLEVLGGFDLVVDGVSVELPPSVQRVLGFLALQRRRVPRVFVAENLWIDTSTSKASANLRTAIHRLQGRAAGVLDIPGSQISISPDVGVDIFEATDHADVLLGSETREPITVDLRPLENELLPGWYDDWVVIARERLRQRFMHALEALAAARIEEARYGSAIDAAMAAVRFEPLREAPRRLLMKAHLAEGNISEAVRERDRYIALMSRELGIPPSPSFLSMLPQAQQRRVRRASA